MEKAFSIVDTREDFAGNWPRSAITLEDCQEIPCFQPCSSPTYEELGYPGSWFARHKQSGECFRVTSFHRYDFGLMITTVDGRHFHAEDCERLYQPGDWKGDLKVTGDDIYRLQKEHRALKLIFASGKR